MWTDVSTIHWAVWGQWTSEEETSAAHQDESGQCKLLGLGPIKTRSKSARRPIKRTNLTGLHKHSNRERKNKINGYIPKHTILCYIINHIKGGRSLLRKEAWPSGSPQCLEFICQLGTSEHQNLFLSIFFRLLWWMWQWVFRFSRCAEFSSSNPQNTAKSWRNGG